MPGIKYVEYVVSTTKNLALPKGIHSAVHRLNGEINRINRKSFISQTPPVSGLFLPHEL